MFFILVIALAGSIVALSVMIRLIRREGMAWCCGVAENNTNIELFSVDVDGGVIARPAPVERRRYWRVRITCYYTVTVALMLVAAGLCASLFAYPLEADKANVIGTSTDTVLDDTTLPEQTSIANVPILPQVLSAAESTSTVANIYLHYTVSMGEAAVLSTYDNVEIINN